MRDCSLGVEETTDEARDLVFCMRFAAIKPEPLRPREDDAEDFSVVSVFADGSCLEFCLGRTCIMSSTIRSVSAFAPFTLPFRSALEPFFPLPLEADFSALFSKSGEESRFLFVSRFEESPLAESKAGDTVVT